ncbi:MAG: hypothetical protein JSS44_10625 [Proteobacteria bacterium]|nr:hypothetical protein [Pseudomonadota bacterium]
MQVEAIFRQGRLELLQPLRLKHDGVRVVVTVPAEEVDTNNPYGLSDEVVAQARTTAERMAALLDAPLPPDDELPELTEKQLERMAAFELRDEVKRMR